LNVAVEEIIPDKVDLYKTIALSVGTTYRVEETGSKITCQLKNKSRYSEWFFLAVDEPTDMPDALQLLFFIRGVTAKF
jgi:hypothetical protein